MLVGLQPCAVQVEVNHPSFIAGLVSAVHLAIADLREAAMWPASRHRQPRGFAGSKHKV